MHCLSPVVLPFLVDEMALRSAHCTRTSQQITHTRPNWGAAACAGKRPRPRNFAIPCPTPPQGRTRRGGKRKADCGELQRSHCTPRPLPPKLRHKFAPGPPQFSINCLTPSPLFRTSCCYTSRHHSCFVSYPSAFVRCPRFSRTRPPHSVTTWGSNLRPFGLAP